ncbi:MAG: hypothetical protein ACFCBW_10905 [Candidatus Competibacterales bacterium]
MGLRFPPEAGGPGSRRWPMGHAVELAPAGIDVPALGHRAWEVRPGLGSKAQWVLQSYLDNAGP